MAEPFIHHLLSVLLLLLFLYIPSSSTYPQCQPYFGRPDYYSCYRLLFGDRDAVSNIILSDGISRIDRKDHLFHVNAANLQAPPPGVSALQFRWVLPLPQPDYPATWRSLNPGVEAPTQSRFGPVPWSNEGCKIMLLPVQLSVGGMTWDTSRFKTLAEIGGNINTACVWQGAGQSPSGGIDFAGANGRMLLVLFQQGSDFDKRMKAVAAGEPAHLDEEEVWGEEEEEIEGVDTKPRGAKRVRIDTGSAAGSSTWMGEYSITRAIPADVGAGWLTQYNAVKLILPVADAARQLVAFYEHVVEKASAQIRTRAAELKMLAFTLGSISLVLSGTDVVHWDWIIDFAMSMEDSTNAGNPIQYSSTVASKWQQNTIKVELLLDGVAAA
ncbi:MAG: hypothetical protein Q9193_006639 [Seirophora villosa]